MKRVFISSTATDLQSHRNAVRDGVRQLGLVDVAMELFGADDARPKDLCLRKVREESDFFVGIYAHRYGYVPEGESISIPELEYEAATLAGLPRFIYLIDPDYPWPPRLVDQGPAKEGLDRLRNRLLASHVCQRFGSEHQLATRVVADLGRHQSIRGADRVGPGLEIEDIGFDSLRGKVVDTPEEWSGIRDSLYEDSRGVFLVHVIEPSKKPDQEFDIYIYLLRHQSEDLSDVRVADFFLGKYWGNKVFPAAQQPNGFIGIATAAYGTFLCVCKVTFQDGHQVLLSRYVDFEARRQGA